MVVKNKCGHFNTWVMRLMGGGKRFTYCLGCLIEKIGLDNIEDYDNPFINIKTKEEEKKKKETSKKKKTEQ